ncbi:cadherin-like beta sandwich domain-containing protein [Cohnella faecalis]|uniref:Cadherin-like beta sandwich domain-containing protein n=1 Tax=Cohnella faecalis TaxID=2315694 RepID=A0A398CIF9_9BACL|nr:cadherin-like beta sandwich domain-containing protein [Cohnella faecalis]RIE00628.1 hypothetical protein D3H35_27055 [Cohnella faecalis]
MKIRKLLMLSLASLLLALPVLGLFADDTFAATSRVAIIKELKGTVQVKKSGGSKQFKAFAKMSLNEGDILSTGSGGSAVLQFANGTSEDDKMTVSANTTLTFSKLSDRKGTRTKVSMLSGSAWVDVKSISSKNDEFTLETPTAIMGVRGTHLYTYVDPVTGNSRLAVGAGVVRVSTPDNSSEYRDIVPTQDVLATQDDDGNGKITIAPIDLQRLLSQSDSAVVDAILQSAAEIAKENEQLMQKYLEEINSGSATEEERHKRNIENLLGAIVDQALTSGLISKERVDKLISDAQQGSGVTIDLSKKELDFSEQEKREQELFRQKQAQALAEAEKKKQQELAELQKKMQDELKKLQEQRKAAEEANKKAEEAKRKQAEELYKKQLDEAAKKKFEEEQAKNEGNTGSTSSGSGSSGGSSQAPKSQNADLSGLSLSNGANISFAASTTNYEANVLKNVVSVSVTPTTAHSKATIKVNGTNVTSGASAAIALGASGTTKSIDVVVTAEDGTTTRTYHISVYRSLISAVTLPTNLGIQFDPAKSSYYIPAVSETTASIPMTFGSLTDSVKVQLWVWENGGYVLKEEYMPGQSFNVTLNPGNNDIEIRIVPYGSLGGAAYTQVASLSLNSLLGVVETAPVGSSQTYKFQVWKKSGTESGLLYGIDLWKGAASYPVAKTVGSATEWNTTVPGELFAAEAKFFPAEPTDIIVVNNVSYKYGQSVPLSFPNSTTVAFVLKSQSGETKGTFSLVVNKTPILSGENAITAFSLPGQIGTSVIDSAEHTVAVKLPHGSSLIDLQASFTLSVGATAKVNDLLQASGSTANNFSSSVTYVVTAANGNVQNWTVTVTVAPSGENAITAFSLPGQIGTSVIDSAEHTVAVKLPHGSSLIDLQASFTLSVGAKAKVNDLLQASGSTANNFSSSVTYVVTAANGNVQNWTVTVTVAPSGENAITAFSLPGQIGTSVIDSAEHTVAVKLPHGSSLIDLQASFTLSVGAKAKVNDLLQASGSTANNFSSSVTYVVTAANGNVQNWTVTVTVAPSGENAIMAFSLPEQTGPAVIDPVAHTVAIQVAHGTNVTNLKATFALSSEATAKVGSTTQVSGTTLNSFTSPVTYQVIAANGNEQNWTVTVTVAPSGENAITAFSLTEQTGPAVIDPVAHTVAIQVAHGTNVTSLKATFALSSEATAKVGSTTQVSGTTLNSFTSPVTYKVIAANGSEQNWTVTVTVAPSGENAITAFSLTEQTGPADIDPVAHTVAIQVAHGTNVTNLKATFALSSGATAKVGGTLQESGLTLNSFTSPVTYKVIAANGSEQNWTVTVTVAPSGENAITAFSLSEQTGPAVIDPVAHTVAIQVAHGTNVTSLKATFALSSEATAKVGSTTQVSGTTLNSFTSPVTYKVTAANGSEQNWTVTVTVAPSGENAITAFSLSEQTGPAVIDPIAHTVTIQVAQGTSLIGLIPTFTLSTGATAKVGGTLQESGLTSNNFTNSVTYTVTAENETVQNWVVTVTSQLSDGITQFTLENAQGILPLKWLYSSSEWEDIITTEYSTVVNETDTSVQLEVAFSGAVTSASVSNSNGEEIHDYDNSEGPISFNLEQLLDQESPYTELYIEYSYDGLSYEVKLTVLRGDAPEEELSIYDPGMNYSEFTLLPTNRTGDRDFVGYVPTETAGYSIAFSPLTESDENYVTMYRVVGESRTELSMESFGFEGIPYNEQGWFDFVIEVWDKSRQQSREYRLSVYRGADIPSEFAGIAFEGPAGNTHLGVYYANPTVWFAETAAGDQEYAMFKVGTPLPNGVAVQSVKIWIDGEASEPGTESGYYKIPIENGAVVVFQATNGRSFAYRIEAIPSFAPELMNVKAMTPSFGDLSTVEFNVAGEGTLVVPEQYSSIRLRPYLVNDLSSVQVTVDGQTVKYGYGSRNSVLVSVEDGKEIEIVLYSPSGALSRTYKLTLNPPLSGENDFESFGFLGTAADGVIDPVNHTVNVTLPYNAEVTALVAKFVLSANAAATIDGIAQASGSTSNDFTDPVAYRITAENGDFQVWTVTVQREQSSNANLASLAFSNDLSIPPPYFEEVINLTARVDYGTKYLTIYATTEDPLSTITASGYPFSGGQATVPLTAVGAPGNIIPITVTAQSGATKTYQVKFIRDNTALQGVQVNGSSVEEFNSDVTTNFFLGNILARPDGKLEVKSVYDTSAAKIVYKVKSSSSEDWTEIVSTSGTSLLPVAPGMNDLKIIVKAADGAAIQTVYEFSVNITTAEDALPEEFDQLNFVVNGVDVPLTPVFDHTVYGYRVVRFAAEIAAIPSTLALHAVTNASLSEVSINDESLYWSEPGSQEDYSLSASSDGYYLYQLNYVSSETNTIVELALLVGDHPLPEDEPTNVSNIWIRAMDNYFYPDEQSGEIELPNSVSSGELTLGTEFDYNYAEVTLNGNLVEEIYGNTYELSGLLPGWNQLTVRVFVPTGTFYEDHVYWIWRNPVLTVKNASDEEVGSFELTRWGQEYSIFVPNGLTNYSIGAFNPNVWTLNGSPLEGETIPVTVSDGKGELELGYEGYGRDALPITLRLLELPEHVAGWTSSAGYGFQSLAWNRNGVGFFAVSQEYSTRINLSLESGYSWTLAPTVDYAGYSSNIYGLDNGGYQIYLHPGMQQYNLTITGPDNYSESYTLSLVYSDEPIISFINGSEPTTVSGISFGDATYFVLPESASDVYYHALANDTHSGITSGPLDTFPAFVANDTSFTDSAGRHFYRHPTYVYRGLPDELKIQVTAADDANHELETYSHNSGYGSVVNGYWRENEEMHPVSNVMTSIAFDSASTIELYNEDGSSVLDIAITEIDAETNVLRLERFVSMGAEYNYFVKITDTNGNSMVYNLKIYQSGL